MALTLTPQATPSGTLAQFSSTTSNELASVINDETGSGSLVFANGPTLSGIVNAATLYLSKTAAQTINVVAAGATAVIDCSLGNYFTRTISTTTTWSFSNIPTSSYVYVAILELTNGGAFAQSWPASVRWPIGIAPTLSSTANGVDVISFITDDGGTTWRGSVVIQDSKTAGGTP
jgi:hypothetical protein